MTKTPHLSLPLLAAAQAQQHVTHNEALAALDALVQLAVTERRAAPPAHPGEGARYLVGEGASGAFAGQEHAVALFDLGVWRFFAPRAGWRAYVEAEARVLVFDGALWRDLGEFVRELGALGIGTAPDAQNLFAAKINAALFTARGSGEGGTGDLRLVLNKEGAARTVSQVFQSGYGGRAELGLAGDDDFRIKVSADGATWHEALRIVRATGAVSAPGGIAAGGHAVWTNGTAPKSLAVPGHQTLPSGLILQWGSGSGAGADPAIAFSIPFPTACLSLVASARLNAGDAALAVCAVDLVTATGFTARPRAVAAGGAVSAGTQAFNWFALGH